MLGLGSLFAGYSDDKTKLRRLVSRNSDVGKADCLAGKAIEPNKSGGPVGRGRLSLEPLLSGDPCTNDGVICLFGIGEGNRS